MTDLPAVLLLHGTDELAIAEVIEKLARALGDPSSVAMNLTRFDGRAGLDFEALNNAVNALPFLSARRLVVLVHPSAAFPTSVGRRKFIGLLDQVPQTTSLALVEYEVLKQDHWLVKWAQHARVLAKVQLHAMPKRGDMPRWILEETKKQGGQIERPAAARLAEMIGEDTRLAAQEITKILTYVNYERPVTEMDVERVGIASAQSSVFDLVDALGMGDGHTAQKVLHRLFENEDPLEFWGMVIRQFRLLILAREISESGGREREVQESLGLRDFVAKKVYRQAQRFSLTALEAIYHRLLDIDLGAKTSQVPLDLALDTFVAELAQKN
jgi:DNA polymerase-3 subunit delta